MKITVKPKAEVAEVYTIRIPASLKRRLDALRKRADDLSADFNATLIGTLDEFATDLQAQFDRPRSKSAGASVNGSSDGSVPNASVR
jgi:hypothetical protein